MSGGPLSRRPRAITGRAMRAPVRLFRTRSRPINESLAELSQPARDLLDAELASLLIRLPYEWRERRVESIVPLNELFYRDRISLQFTIWSRLFQRALEGTVRRGRGGDRGLTTLARQARRLPSTEWDGECVDVFVPLFSMKKRLALYVDVEDSGGHRLTLGTRRENTHVLTHHVLRLLEATNLFAPADTDAIRVIVTTIVFAIPRGARRFDATSAARSGMTFEAWLREVDGTLDGSVDSSMERLARRVWEKSILLEQAVRPPGTPPAAAEDPVRCPLPLLPDLPRVLGRPGAPIPLRTDHLGTFLEAADRYLDAVETLMAQEASYVSARRALHNLERFAHNGLASARMPIVLGQANLVKLTQRVRSTHEPRKVLGKFGAPWSFLKGVPQRYPVLVGDARSTHVQIQSPDPSSIKLAGDASSLVVGRRTLWGPAGIEQVFGSGDYEASDALAFYTAKTVDEVNRRFGDDLSSDSERTGGIALNVYYRLRLGLVLVYLAVALFSLAVAVDAMRNWPWEEVPIVQAIYPHLPKLGFRLETRDPASQTLVVGLTTVIVGFLALREKATIASHATLPARVVFFLVLIVLLLDAGGTIFAQHIR